MTHLRLALCLLAALPVSLPTALAIAQTSVGSRVDAAHGCTTSPVADWELRRQLAEAESCWYPSALVPVSPRSGLTFSSTILRFMSPQTRDAVYAASSRRSFNVNSAFRTLLEQYYLYTARSPRCMSVATPGSSNHESGTAVDVSPDGTTASVRSALEGAGCRWYGSGDRVHFDCLPRGATRRTVITFQRLWNLNHPEDRIAEDNSYGPQTQARLRASPLRGFARTPCSEPPPPPSCHHSAGGFSFSCDGVLPDMHCVSLDEPEDPDSWDDNYLCSAADVGFVWSTEGPVSGMRCVNTHESADAHAEAWSDDYACVPEESTLDLAWSSNGPLEGWSCVQWDEPEDPGTWSDNYLCVRALRCDSAGILTFCSDGAVEGLACVAVDEPEDPDTWDNNYLCSVDEIGMVWSAEGSIDGMTCTAIVAPDDDESAAWADNYLCVPDDSAFVFTWSNTGPVEGMDCVRWYESAEADTEGWTESYLCVEAAPASSDPDAGSAPDPARHDGGARVELSTGCSCRAGSRTGSPLGLVLLLALAWCFRERRRGGWWRAQLLPALESLERDRLRPLLLLLSPLAMRIALCTSLTPEQRSAIRSTWYFISRSGSVPLSVTSASLTETSTSLTSTSESASLSQTSSRMRSSERVYPLGLEAWERRPRDRGEPSPSE